MKFLVDTKKINKLKKEKKDRTWNNKQIYNVSKVDGKYINKYLLSRNLKINRVNSLNKKKIDNLSHYIWWFNNNRKSYVFKNMMTKLFFFTMRQLK